MLLWKEVPCFRNLQITYCVGTRVCNTCPAGQKRPRSWRFVARGKVESEFSYPQSLTQAAATRRPSWLCAFGPAVGLLTPGVNYLIIPGYCCQRSAFLWLLPLHGALCLCCRKGKAFCERQFALLRQQLEKDKRNVNVASPGKISADTHGHRWRVMMIIRKRLLPSPFAIT